MRRVRLYADIKKKNLSFEANPNHKGRQFTQTLNLKLKKKRKEKTKSNKGTRSTRSTQKTN